MWLCACVCCRCGFVADPIKVNVVEKPRRDAPRGGGLEEETKRHREEEQWRKRRREESPDIEEKEIILSEKYKRKVHYVRS